MIHQKQKRKPCMDFIALDALACKECDATMILQALKLKVTSSNQAWIISLTCIVIISQKALAEGVIPPHPLSRKLRAGKAGRIPYPPRQPPRPPHVLKAPTPRPPIPPSRNVKAGRPPSCFPTRLGC